MCRSREVKWKTRNSDSAFEMNGKRMRGWQEMSISRLGKLKTRTAWRGCKKCRYTIENTRVKTLKRRKLRARIYLCFMMYVFVMDLINWKRSSLSLYIGCLCYGSEITQLHPLIIRVSIRENVCDMNLIYNNNLYIIIWPQQ
jgi:hypothetical protein